VCGIAELGGDYFGGFPFEIEAPQSKVLSVERQDGIREKTDDAWIDRSCSSHIAPLIRLFINMIIVFPISDDVKKKIQDIVWDSEHA
jgi:hypothetical protein